MSEICNDRNYDSDMVYIQILQKKTTKNSYTAINKEAITTLSYYM